MRERRARDAPPVVALCILLVALTYFWYFESVGVANDELSALEVRAIPLYVAAVLAGQCVALVVVARLGRRFLNSHLPAALFAGALLALNFYCTFLAHFSPFLVRDDWLQWTILAAAFAVACMVASEIHENRVVRIGAMVVGPLLVAWLFAEDALGGGEGPGARQSLTLANLSPGMATDAATVSKVEFARKPNVYLLSFDALTSDDVAARYLGIPPPLEYSKALEASGARVLANAFADGDWTKHTLNSLLALDVNYFDGLPDSERYGFFTGRRRSPVVEIFRHNGYRIQTMYRDSFLGRWQGPYVDFYGVASEAGACNRVESRLGFLGYCTRQMQAALRRLVPALGRAASEPPYTQFVLERIRVAARDGRPWLTLAYHPLPGHAEEFYDHRRAGDRLAFRSVFARNQREIARDIETMIGTIRELDPGAVVLVFGDHGMLLTRNQGYDGYLRDPEFYVLDHHAVRMAIWPASACRGELDDASKRGFITVALAVRAIITCLAGGVDPVNKTVTYSLPYWAKDRYDRYFYENAPGAPAAAPVSAH